MKFDDNKTRGDTGKGDVGLLGVPFVFSYQQDR